MHALLEDLRCAARTLGKTPGFGFLALSMLVLRIDATPAVCGVNGALLRPLSFCLLFHAPKIVYPAMDWEVRGCWTSLCRVTFCSGLTTSLRLVGRPRGFAMIHHTPFSFLIIYTSYL